MHVDTIHSAPVALEHVIRLPRPARLPSDATALAALAVLTFCPVRSAERRVRSAHISTLITTALAAG